MKRSFHFVTFTLFFSVILCAMGAEAKLCNPVKERCFGKLGGGSSRPAYPSKSSSININPSAVPIEDAFGIEAVIFDGADFSIVKGTGRIGAAISASNGEDSFFGPPAFEVEEDFVDRKRNQKKYESQKINLATAIGIISNKRSGLRRFELNLGVAGKYNRITKKAMPGGGLSGVAGPFTWGYSRGQDQTAIEVDPALVVTPEGKPYLPYDYDTETMSGGVYLNSAAIDYSRMRLLPKNDDPRLHVTLITGSLMLRGFIITVAHRTQEPEGAELFSSPINSLLYVKREDMFGGFQVSLTKVLMVGAYYNYYLFNEVSFGATLFF